MNQIDLAKRIFGKAKIVSGSSNSTQVRYGTVQSYDADNSTVSVLLDGSTEPITATVDVLMEEGQRVTATIDSGTVDVAGMAAQVEKINQDIESAGGGETLVRSYEDGVLVGKTGQEVGALVNADGSFDVCGLTWSGDTPTAATTISSFGDDEITMLEGKGRISLEEFNNNENVFTINADAVLDRAKVYGDNTRAEAVCYTAANNSGSVAQLSSSVSNDVEAGYGAQGGVYVKSWIDENNVRKTQTVIGTLGEQGSGQNAIVLNPYGLDGVYIKDLSISGLNIFDSATGTLTAKPSQFKRLKFIYSDGQSARQMLEVDPNGSDSITVYLQTTFMSGTTYVNRMGKFIFNVSGTNSTVTSTFYQVNHWGSSTQTYTNQNQNVWIAKVLAYNY